VAVITDIAEAVKNELNDGEFSQKFKAVRTYQPVYELPEMKTLHVTVVPKAIEMEGAARSLVQHDYQIDVAVQKKFDTGETVELDPLMTLVEEIIDFFRLRRLKTVSNAICVNASNEPVYSQEHMEQFRQFTGVITLTFRVLR
jgi:hypothetical protein